MEPLAIFNVGLSVLWHKILKYQSGQFKVFTEMHEDISELTLSPFVNLAAIEDVMRNSEAVILSGYGMGNLPTSNERLMQLIVEAIARDVIVVIKTQCHHGSVSDVYATGRYMVNLGCILAQDMTTECLFAKLSYLLGKGYSTDRIK